MASRSTYDVVIVGASIAGCTVATLYGRAGLRVALVERHRDQDAFKQLCTHYIQACATPTIERLGLAGPIEAAGGVRNSIDVWTRWGWSRPGATRPDGAPPYGYNIRRQTIDPMLRRLAAETDGVDLLLGETAEDLVAANGRVEGVVVRGPSDRRRELRARLVVAADGKESKVAERAGVQAKTKPNNRCFYFAHYAGLPLASGNRSQLWFVDRDVAYTFPNDQGVTLLACMPTKEQLPVFQHDPKRSFASLFAALPDGPSLAGAERVSKLLAAVDYPLLNRPVTPRPGLALVGDAALTSDPLWGVGCGWAFQTAEWLVERTAAALRDGDDSALTAGLARYRRRHRQGLAAYQFLNADFATGRPFNPLERLMFSAAARDERLALHLEAFATRTIPVRRFLGLRALSRALLVNARHSLHPRTTTPALAAR
jgi:flavin-dependent dehydrogenase